MDRTYVYMEWLNLGNSEILKELIEKPILALLFYKELTYDGQFVLPLRSDFRCQSARKSTGVGHFSIFPRQHIPRTKGKTGSRKEKGLAALSVQNCFFKIHA